MVINMLNDKRIRVIVGHYGSGKTEFAVNYAMKLAEQTDNVGIADLDVVNVYFRSREKAELMEEKGIRVMSSAYGHSANLDLPSVSAGIFGLLQDDNCQCVLDIGGDSTGAKALGRFKPTLTVKGYDMFLVINTFRLETSTREGIIKHIKEIEAQTGLKITGLVNNSNLLRETTLEEVKVGQIVIESVSDEMKIPIKYVCAIEKVAQTIPAEYAENVLTMQMYMREDWM